ncbi:LOW QUALITY PROTEIN: hypothetical protein HID58_011510 [Brassica napus]|uniref:Uncharacterized protein n=1 Tax=Brassica napus TaxID=3708 RepID=A0ABQ8DYG6_BRANA|nr:LOW QUALITY PROTEIN: hypothetical protein HID58_011510 [Brassica napus]
MLPVVKALLVLVAVKKLEEENLSVMKVVEYWRRRRMNWRWWRIHRRWWRVNWWWWRRVDWWRRWWWRENWWGWWW